MSDEAADTVADDDIPDPFAEAAKSSQLRAFRACLEKLDANSQRCLLLAYYYGYTHEEIAARETAPVGTVKKPYQTRPDANQGAPVSLPS